MNQNEFAENNASQPAADNKKTWVTPVATVEQVSEVTKGIQGGAGDGFNSCHS